jgi:thioredoxin reductase (NADPH)
MFTTDEVRAIPILSAIPTGDLERVARSAADIQLEAGEWAVHEGDERACYAVVSGKIEVVKLFDGVPRTLGWRVPGTIFGEVPLALGSPFPGAYRAAEPSRVLRLTAQQYYIVAAAAPEFAQKMGALARERIGGLQRISEEPPPRKVLGHRWKRRSDLRRFIARNQITFEWMAPDAPDLDVRAYARRITMPCVTARRWAELKQPKARDLARLRSSDQRKAPYDTMGSAAVRRDLLRRSTARRKVCAPWSSNARLRAHKLGHPPELKTTSDFRMASLVMSLQAVRWSKPNGWERKFL